MFVKYYAVIETFFKHFGTECPPPPIKTPYKTVRTPLKNFLEETLFFIKLKDHDTWDICLQKTCAVYLRLPISIGFCSQVTDKSVFMKHSSLI